MTDKEQVNMDLMKKIQDRTAVVGIIGLGYVGLPLVIAFEKAGFPVIGFDLDGEKIRLLGEGKSYIKHISSERTMALKEHGRFRASADFSLLRDTDCVVICVPAPLDKQVVPGLDYVVNTTRTIAQYLDK